MFRSFQVHIHKEKVNGRQTKRFIFCSPENPPPVTWVLYHDNVNNTKQHLTSPEVPATPSELMMNGIMPEITAYASTYNDGGTVYVRLGEILIATIYIDRPTVGTEHDCFDDETKTWCDEDECVSPVAVFEDDLFIRVTTFESRENGFGITVG